MVYEYVGHKKEYSTISVSVVDFEYAGYNINHDVMPREELKERVRDIDILVCEYDTIDAEIFDCAENLKFIVCCRGGVGADLFRRAAGCEKARGENE